MRNGDDLWNPRLRRPPKLHPIRTERWITCGGCGKRAYPTRKIARLAARELAAREGDASVLRAYRCRTEEGDRRFHIGHINPQWIKRDLNATSRTPCCPTSCDTECDLACHEGHYPRHRRDHQPEDCPSHGEPAIEKEAG